MSRPQDPVLLDDQLFSCRFGSIKQTHIGKFNVPINTPLPVDDVIIGNGVSFLVKVDLLCSNFKCYFLEVVLELKSNSLYKLFSYEEQDNTVENTGRYLPGLHTAALSTCVVFERPMSWLTEEEIVEGMCDGVYSLINIISHPRAGRIHEG